MRKRLACDYRLVVQNPGKKRPTFRILKFQGDKCETLKHPTLDTINEAYRNNRFDFEAAKKNVEDLREQLYQAFKAYKAVVHNSENQRLFDQYWEAEYAGRNLEDPATAKYELLRAVEAVGPLSIYSASREELQRAVDVFQGNKQRRIVSALTRLLVFAKRPEIKLRRAKKEKRKVRAITEKDFRLVLKHIEPDAFRLLHEVAFYTGARIGECFAMEPEDFNESKLELRIEAQIDKKGSRRDTKNDKERVTLVFPNGVKALKKWFSAKHSISLESRKHMSRITKEACEKQFPSDSRKHLTFHDLRHCYAKMCRERGLTTEHVADLIGDSIIVTKEHYTGFGPTDGVMEIMRKAIKKKAS